MTDECVELRAPTSADLATMKGHARALRLIWWKTLGMLGLTTVLYLACALACVTSAWEGNVPICLLNAAAAGANQHGCYKMRTLLKQLGEERARCAWLIEQINEALGRKT